MKAILTKTLPATNHRPARIKASAEGCKPEIRSCNALHEIAETKISGEHITLAKLYAYSHGWSTNLASGQLPNGDWVHCFIPDRNLKPELVKILEWIESLGDASEKEAADFITNNGEDVETHLREIISSL